jgi:hypothetical protein
MEKLPIMKADEETQNKLKDVVLKLISLNNELQDFINESLGFFSKKF